MLLQGVSFALLQEASCDGHSLFEQLVQHFSLAL
jgi:hypothetical protein